MNQKKKYIVKDYMQKQVATISKNATFKEAVEKMIHAKTNGLVVVNGNNQVIGIISSWDLIQHIVPDYLEEDRHLASFESPDVFEKRIQEVQDNPITKFMTMKVLTVMATDSIMEASTLLSEFRIRQLPVVNDEKKLVGYINRTDIKRAVGEALGISFVF